MSEFVALLSGGKDSIFSVMECVAHGYELKAILNLMPTMDHACSLEVDSYMYQSVASEGLKFISNSLQVPLYQFPIVGTAECRSLYYSGNNPSDEVEDLFHALSVVKREMPSISYVSSGAILSDYQRIRVENVAARLSLRPLSFLWRRPPDELLQTIISAYVDSIIVKVASFGLSPEFHLGKRLSDVADQLLQLSKSPHCLNVCGEGGEYETFTLDCPMFHQRICIASMPKTVIHSADAFAPVAYLQFTDLSLEDKPVSKVCRTQQDILAICGSSSLSSRRPFLTPIERLTDLGRDFTSESSNDFSQLPQTPTFLSPSTTQRLLLTNPSPCGPFTPFAGDSLWISEAYVGTCKSPDNRETAVICATKDAAKLAQDHLASAGLTANHVVLCICLLNQPLTDEILSAFNSVYVSVFGMPWESGTLSGAFVRSPPHRCFPPSRICLFVDDILCPDNQRFIDSSEIAVSLTVVVHPFNINGLSPLDGGCRGLHVQSISHWAPASTGPYSQAVTVLVSPSQSSSFEDTHNGCDTLEDGTDDLSFEYTFFSGQTGLIPESLTLPTALQFNRSEDHAVEIECLLALRHCHRLLKAVSSYTWLNLYAGICFGVTNEVLQHSKRAFHSTICSVWFASSTSDGFGQCVCDTHIVWARVSGLSNNSSVEWQFFTQTHARRHLQSPLLYGEPDTLACLQQSCVLFCTRNPVTRHHGKCAIFIGGLLDRTEAAVVLTL